MLGELTGYRVGITAHRKADEFTDLLTRHGAEVVQAPALQLVPAERDDEVIEATRRIIAQQPDVVVVTTAYGLRRWQETAEAVDLGIEFLATLDRARILCRGSKAQGQVVRMGLRRPEAFGGRTGEVVDQLVGEGLAGTRVALQMHGLADVASVSALQAAGAEVETIAPYRWLSADDGERLASLVRGLVAGNVHLVAFTAAPAVDATFSTAAGIGLADELAAALASPDEAPAVAAVGPVTAEPLLELGITPVMPERFRLGALARAIQDHAERQLTVRVSGPDGEIQVRGAGYVVADDFHPLDDAAALELRRLAREHPEQVADWVAAHS